MHLPGAQQVSPNVRKKNVLSCALVGTHKDDESVHAQSVLSTSSVNILQNKLDYVSF